MNQQQTLEQLQQLKLNGMVKRYEAVIATGVHEQPEPHMLIAWLAEAEASYRVHQANTTLPEVIKTSLQRYH